MSYSGKCAFSFFFVVFVLFLGISFVGAQSIRENPSDSVTACAEGQYARISEDGLVCADTSPSPSASSCASGVDCCGAGEFVKITPTGLDCYAYLNGGSGCGSEDPSCSTCPDCCGDGVFAFITTEGLVCIGRPEWQATTLSINEGAYLGGGSGFNVLDAVSGTGLTVASVGTLPSWLSLKNNILSGQAPEVAAGNKTTYTVNLTASNSFASNVPGVITINVLNVCDNHAECGSSAIYCSNPPDGRCLSCTWDSSYTACSGTSRVKYCRVNGTAVRSSTVACSAGQTCLNGVCGVTRNATCSWGGYSSYGSCSVTACGSSGTRTRTRTCSLLTSASHGGTSSCSCSSGYPADTTQTDSQTCLGTICPSGYACSGNSCVSTSCTGCSTWGAYSPALSTFCGARNVTQACSTPSPSGCTGGYSPRTVSRTGTLSCSSGQSCSNGSCAADCDYFPSCSLTSQDCPSTSTCGDTRTRSTACTGGCTAWSACSGGTACSAGQVCVSGQCQDCTSPNRFANGICGAPCPAQIISGCSLRTLQYGYYAPSSYASCASGHTGSCSGAYQCTTSGGPFSVRDASLNTCTACTPVNGGWTATSYSGYGSCTATTGSCGAGTKSRTWSRTCTNPAPSCGGSTCSGLSSGTNSASCTVACSSGQTCSNNSCVATATCTGGTTIVGCVLSSGTTAHLGTKTGSCGSGYTGSCSYQCNNGNWTAVTACAVSSGGGTSSGSSNCDPVCSDDETCVYIPTHYAAVATYNGWGSTYYGYYTCGANCGTNGSASCFRSGAFNCSYGYDIGISGYRINGLIDCSFISGYESSYYYSTDEEDCFSGSYDSNLVEMNYSWVCECPDIVDDFVADYNEQQASCSGYNYGICGGGDSGDGTDIFDMCAGTLEDSFFDSALQTWTCVYPESAGLSEAHWECSPSSSGYGSISASCSASAPARSSFYNTGNPCCQEGARCDGSTRVSWSQCFEGSRRSCSYGCAEVGNIEAWCHDCTDDSDGGRDGGCTSTEPHCVSNSDGVWECERSDSIDL